MNTCTLYSDFLTGFGLHFWGLRQVLEFGCIAGHYYIIYMALAEDPYLWTGTLRVIWDTYKGSCVGFGVNSWGLHLIRVSGLRPPPK